MNSHEENCSHCRSRSRKRRNRQKFHWTIGRSHLQREKAKAVLKVIVQFIFKVFRLLECASHCCLALPFDHILGVLHLMLDATLYVIFSAATLVLSQIARACEIPVQRPIEGTETKQETSPKRERDKSVDKSVTFGEAYEACPEKDENEETGSQQRDTDKPTAAGTSKEADKSPPTSSDQDEAQSQGIITTQLMRFSDIALYFIQLNRSQRVNQTSGRSSSDDSSLASDTEPDDIADGEHPVDKERKGFDAGTNTEEEQQKKSKAKPSSGTQTSRARTQSTASSNLAEWVPSSVEVIQDRTSEMMEYLMDKYHAIFHTVSEQGGETETQEAATSEGHEHDNADHLISRTEEKLEEEQEENDEP